MRVVDKQSKAHRIAVDMGGGSIAQASTELINWGMRALGRWSKDGFIASNVDLLQGFELGLGLHLRDGDAQRPCRQQRRAAKYVA